MRRLSRTELRRRHRSEFQRRPIIKPQVTYDPAGFMAVFDQMPRRLRDEINDRGLEQDIFDRLPDRFQRPIALALNLEDSDSSVANVWDD